MRLTTATIRNNHTEVTLDRLSDAGNDYRPTIFALSEHGTPIAQLPVFPQNSEAITQFCIEVFEYVEGYHPNAGDLAELLMLVGSMCWDGGRTEQP